MMELIDHFNDAWSSPGDLWKPSAVIDKVESMLEKEKSQIIDAFDMACQDQDRIGKEYFNETYKQD